MAGVSLSCIVALRFQRHVSRVVMAIGHQPVDVHPECPEQYFFEFSRSAGEAIK